MRAALLSFRLGGLDGVSVVAETWRRALTATGCDVVTVAGAGPVDRLVPGLEWPPVHQVDGDRLRASLADADVVIVENLLSLPLNPGAWDAVEAVLHGRPAVLHHHDLPWQRAGHDRVPPTDAAWRHVTVNDRSRDELAGRGIEAVTVRPIVEVDEPAGDAAAVPFFDPGEVVLLHPVRAIARKDVPAAVRLAEALGATYWLTGPAEEGYDVAAALAGARCRIVHRPAPGRVADAYAAASAVAFPSTWEGFGMPVLESALWRRPLAIRRYPVADELAAFGFRWFPHDDPDAVAGFLRHPDEALLDHNEAVVRRHFSPARLEADLAALMATWDP